MSEAVAVMPAVTARSVSAAVAVSPLIRMEAVTKTYDQIRWKDLPVILAFEDWHPGRRGQIPRHAVYFGASRADWATDLTKYQNRNLRADQLWQELVCDIGRFGGIRLPGCR